MGADRRPGRLVGVLLLRHDSRQGNKIWNDRDNINDVHDVPKEVELVRTGEEAHPQFERKPHYTNRLYEEEGVGDVRHFVFLDLGAVGRRVEHAVVLELGQRLEAEDDDGQQDDHDGDDSHHAGGLRALRVLEQQPHLALELVARKGFLLLLDEALIFPANTNRTTPSTPHFLRPLQPPSALRSQSGSYA